jgi:hypothetical protein
MPAATVAVSRPSGAPGKPEGPRSRPVLLVGVALAAWTVLLGLAVLVCLSLAGWVSAARHDDSAASALAVAVQAWLLAQRGTIDLGTGSISLVPLGLSAALVALAVRGGRLTARHSGARDLLDAAGGVLVYAVSYAVIAALLTAAGGLGSARPVALQALVGSFLLAAAGAGFGALRETDQLGRLIKLVRSDVRAMLRAGAAASAALLGVGALVLILGLATNAGRVGRLAGSLHGGVTGAVLLVVVCAAYLPNAVIWAAAYCLGPGFAVGAGTSVSVAGAQLGAVPSFPLFAPLPDSGPAPWFAWLVLVGPVGAGVLAGWLLARPLQVSRPAADARWWVRARLREPLPALAAAAAAAVLLAAVVALSGGALGGAHLRTLGPSAWRVSLATFILVGAAATATVWLRGWWELRTSGSHPTA